MSNQALPVVDLNAVACCSPIAASPMGVEQAAVVAPMFKALGDPVRLRLMSMIASVREICVCDLTPAFDPSGPTISHHLKLLRVAGLVDSERAAPGSGTGSSLRRSASSARCSTSPPRRPPAHCCCSTGYH
ncbi:ArsR/SmtB family transcription factor [Micromonospora aurantiaca (nom. illeg.)]|uniref:ArsR/SmtB family transcription factor n=1 Tax=Micromonospora aurantiaca (nom. illeg.) TaxID=47850 RepID=UPI0033C2EF8E